MKFIINKVLKEIGCLYLKLGKVEWLVVECEVVKDNFDIG